MLAAAPPPGSPYRAEFSSLFLSFWLRQSISEVRLNRFAYPAANCLAANLCLNDRPLQNL